MNKRRLFLVLGTTAVTAGAAIWCPWSSSGPFARVATASIPNGPRPVTLVDKNVPVPLRLLERKIINHDTELFRFELPSKDHVLGLSVGQHVNLQTGTWLKKVVRQYTPVSSDNDKGVMDLVIKLYRPSSNTSGGRMSAVLDNLSPGDSMNVSGPSGSFLYQGRGQLAFKHRERDAEPTIFHDVKKVIMIAGGSGITPMLQFIKAVVKDPEDKTQMELLFANKTEEDIILREELEAIAKIHPGKLKLWYTVSTAPTDWKYSVGHVNEDMIRDNLSPPSSDTFVFLCGPWSMIKRACQPALKQLGYDKKRIYEF